VIGDGSPIECVVNVSEGRDLATINSLSEAGGGVLLDVHTDPDHHRCVLTLGGPAEAVEEAARRIAVIAVARIDIGSHAGVHPRIGALDVVPFVPLSPNAPSDSQWNEVLGARDRFARWAGDQLQLPCFLYGPERSLPEVRNAAFRSLVPDTGPPAPHPTAGASAVGCRPILIAYNVWITGSEGSGVDPGHALSVARTVAADLRSPTVRALGLAVGDGAQVSCNLIDPATVSIAGIYDAVAAGAEAQSCSVIRAELVGLVPTSALLAAPRHRWPELDLSEDRTIEGRIDAKVRS
jgi:glutamate formiminotransferase / 5-formyltetrahydrofolate cyclo-ligase